MRADRLLSIMLILQARGRATAFELSCELEVSERTIYRDLEALSMAGVPIYADRGPGGGYMLMEGYRAGLTALTDEEARSLMISSMPGQLADLGMEKTLHDAMLKLLASLPGGRREEARRQRTFVHLDATPWFRTPFPTTFLKLIQRGMIENRQLRLSYRKGDGEQTDRIIEPYGLVAKAHLWYVVANTRRGMRVYRVSRIIEAQMLTDTFERPHDFDLAAFWVDWAKAFEESMSSAYLVRARVSPEFIPMLPDRFGSGILKQIAKAEQEEDGWITIQVYFDSESDACDYMMGLGPMVEVLSPLELRAHIAKAMQKTAELYARRNKLVESG